MFTCAGPRRRATVSDCRNTRSRGDCNGTDGRPCFWPGEATIDDEKHQKSPGGTFGSKPRVLARKLVSNWGRHLDTIPERAAGSAPLHYGAPTMPAITKVDSLRPPPPVIHAPVYGHKRMMSAPITNRQMSMPLDHQSPWQVSSSSLSTRPRGTMQVPLPLQCDHSSISMSRLKRASTISTVDSRMHSLLIPSDSRAAHNIDRFVAVSSGADMDADIMFPRWGNAPSVSSFMMADGSVDGRSPYLCHSASRSIGSRGLDSGSATTRSSTTLWLAPVPKTPQSLTPTAKRSNERSFVVHTAAEQCEWRQSWDVI